MTAPLLGLYGGAASVGISRIVQAEKWLHRGVAVMGDCYPRDTWANVLNAKSWAVPAWRATPRIKAIGVPLCTENDGPKYDLAGAATGAYDAKYVAICDGLSGVPNLVLRPGWEGNGGWYPWGMNDGSGVAKASRAPLYVAAFQRFVAIARARLPGVLISWNMTWGNLGVPTQNLYPGDGYVDIVSMDVYNKIYSAMPDETARFNYLRDSTNGLAWQATFAAAHRKLLAWDEWGSGSCKSGATELSQDSPVFIKSMAAWAAAKGFLYHTYFNYPASDGQWQVSPDWTTVPGTGNANATPPIPPSPAKVFPNQRTQFLATYGVIPMSNVLDDADAQCDATRLALLNADTTLSNAVTAQSASATAAAAAVTNAQAARDAAKAAHLSAVDAYRTASASY